jgi:hypothetical protein
VDEKYRHVQGHVVVTLSIGSSPRRPNALRNDRAIISHDVIKKPRRPIGGGVDGGISTGDSRASSEESFGPLMVKERLKGPFVNSQEPSEVKRRIPRPKRSGDGAVGVQ